MDRETTISRPLNPVLADSAVQLASRREGTHAGIVEMICVRGLRACEIAQLLRVEPPVVSQQLRRVKKVLPEVMERVEVSWDY